MSHDPAANHGEQSPPEDATEAIVPYMPVILPLAPARLRLRGSFRKACWPATRLAFDRGSISFGRVSNASKQEREGMDMA